MAPNQYEDDEVAVILELETRQRQDRAAREALGEAEPPQEPPPEPPPRPRPAPQRARRPPERR